ncbi:MAG: hydrogenase maturation protease [Syntrophobacteraceae bacterium]|nr:hydrogenase maturation protease [Syntrophobacteraceae bacterium]
MTSDMFEKEVLIFGCGNTLLGDDGFGPAVIEYLEKNFRLPPSVMALDAGTGIRGILFDLMLIETRPRELIVIDAVEYPGRTPGELFEIPVEGIPDAKAGDFSMHQFPTVNMLLELQDHADIHVQILVVQIESIPGEVRPGLSGPVAQAVPRACAYLMEKIENILAV